MTLRARKRFGQHFLHDRHVINRIIDSIDFTDDHAVVEIGPGRGALTFPLLERIRPLHVVEIDIDLAASLQDNTEHSTDLVVYRQDALKLDYCRAFDKPLIIVGNLPYNISTPLLFHLLNNIACIKEMVFMVQKEVAVRINAEPGSRDYGRLSVMIQSLCDVELLFDVGPGSFQPPPRVDSTVMKLLPRNDQTAELLDRQLFRDLVRTAFSKRRKTIRNSLKGMVDEQTLESAGIDTTTRPEQLSVDDYIRLTRLLSA